MWKRTQPPEHILQHYLPNSALRCQKWTPNPWTHPTTSWKLPTTLPIKQCSQMPDMDPNPLKTSCNTAKHTVLLDARHRPQPPENILQHCPKYSALRCQKWTPNPWTHRTTSWKHPTTLPIKQSSQMPDMDPNPLNTSCNTAKHTMFWDARHRPQPPENILQHCQTYSVLRCQTWTPTPWTHPTTLPIKQCSEMLDMDPNHLNTSYNNAQHPCSVLRCQTWTPTSWTYHTTLPIKQSSQMPDMDPNPLNTSCNNAKHTMLWDARYGQEGQTRERTFGLIDWLIDCFKSS